MSKGKLITFLVIVTMALLVTTTNTQAWPSDDQGGAYFVMEVDPADAPEIDGELTREGEWDTEEEVFQETIASISYTDTLSVSDLTLGIVMLTDGDFLYVKTSWITNLDNPDQVNSIGLAFSETDPGAMAQTYDRKVAHFNGSSTEEIDLFNCLNAQGNDAVNLTAFCSGYNAQPGVPDTEAEFEAEFGFDDVGYYEWKIPMGEYEGFNGTEDFLIGEGTYIEIVANPFDNIAGEDVGHGAVATNPLFIQYEPRCFFCQPEGPMDPNATVFNAFFALMISGIFLSFILSGRSRAIAEKLWKVDVSEDMAKESVIMEIAYYNSSFLSLLVTIFFGMYALIGFIYGLWANWGLTGAIINGIPLILGVIAFIDLVNRNQNPQEMEVRPGTDVNDANNFWLVPTLFLAITLLMLVFIGIDVIA